MTVSLKRDPNYKKGLKNDIFDTPESDGFTIPDEMVTLANLQSSRYYGLSERMRERSNKSSLETPVFLSPDGLNIAETAEQELKARKEAFGKSEGLLRRKVEMGERHPFIGVKVVSRFESGIVFATINDAIEFHKSDLGKDENDVEDLIILRRQMDEIFKANGSIWNAESISKLKDLLDSMHYNPLTEGTITIKPGELDLVDKLLSRDSNVRLSIRSDKSFLDGSLLTHSAGVIGGILSHSIPCLDSIIAKAKQSTPDVFYDTEGTIDVKKWARSITLTAKQKSRMTSRQIKKHAKKNK